LKIILSLLLTVFCGAIHAERHTLFSKLLEQDRTITVSLPEGYKKSNSQYPVIYVLDGQWYHSLVESTVREANRFQPLLPEFVVVSIHNSARWKDFTSKTVDEADRRMYQGPYLADEFRSYIKSELIPYVEERYRVNRHRVVFGFSLGDNLMPAAAT